MQQMRVSHCLTEMADALAVSKSGFFAHQRKGERPRVRQDNELSQAIEPIFVASRKTYGSPRIMHALRRSGWRCGKNRIARLMRSRGLRAKQKRRFRPQTTRSDHKLPVAPNWLARIPKPDRPGPGLASRYYLHPNARGLALSFRRPGPLLTTLYRLARAGVACQLASQ